MGEFVGRLLFITDCGECNQFIEGKCIELNKEVEETTFREDCTLTAIYAESVNEVE